MVLNQMDNRTLKQDLIDECRLNVAYDSIPSTVIPSIQPVVLLEKKYQNIIVDVGATATTNPVTIYTTPTDRDFYLCSIAYAAVKSATCDVAASSNLVSVTINGVAVAIPLHEFDTLTAETISTNIPFSPGLKIDRGTALSLVNNTFTAGVFRRRYLITGFTSLSTAQELR